MDHHEEEDVDELMHSAIRKGSADAVRKLINSYGLSYSKKWSDGYELLYEALRYGQSKVAETLISENCRLNLRIRRSYKPTPLHLAFRNSDANIIDLLLQKGASTNCTYGNRPLLITAVDSSDNASVALLLSHGADANAVDSDGRTALQLAFYHRDKISAKLLLEHGADVDAMDENGETVLYQVVKYSIPSALDRVKLVLLGHPSVHCKSNRAAAVLALGIRDELLKVLLEYGFNILRDDEGNALFNAIRNGNIDRVKEWLENEYDVRKPCKERCTALHVAARYRQTEIARLLKDRGFDEKSRNEVGKTPLDYAFINGDSTMFEILIGSTNVNVHSEFIIAAVRKGYTKFVENLLKMGADVNTRENDRCCQSLLHHAAWNGDIDTVKVLLDFHADVNSTHVINGYSALHFAVKQKYVEISRTLLENGARNNLPSESGLTPLHFACKANDTDFVNLLLENCADVNSLSAEEGSPLHISSAIGNTDIVKTLVNHGADINSVSTNGLTPLDFARLANNSELAAGYCVHKKTFDFLFRRLVMTQAAELYVCEQNMQRLKPETFFLYIHGNISSRPTQINSDFPGECSKEIEMLKHEKIGGSYYPFYHILAANESQLVNLSRNESLAQAFSCRDFKEKFPIYGSMMEWRFKLGVKRRVFEDKCEEYLRQFFPSYPLVCIHLIIGYLTNEDLRIFLDVCEPRPYPRGE